MVAGTIPAGWLILRGLERATPTDHDLLACDRPCILRQQKTRQRGDLSRLNEAPDRRLTRRNAAAQVRTSSG